MFRLLTNIRLGRPRAQQNNFDDGYNDFSYQLQGYNFWANYHMALWAVKNLEMGTECCSSTTSVLLDHVPLASACFGHKHGNLKRFNHDVPCNQL